MRKKGKRSTITEETPVLQEPKANSAVETPILQETKINSAAETQGLQEPSATSGNQLCCLFRSKFHGSWNMVTRKGPGSGHPSSSCVSATAMGTYKICELFSVPRLSALPEVQREGRISFTEQPNFDKETGWDFFDASDRAQFWACLREQKPDLVLMSPECRPFSILMSSNWDRMSERGGSAHQDPRHGHAAILYSSSCIPVGTRPAVSSRTTRQRVQLGDTRHEMARGTAGCFYGAVRSVRGGPVFETRYSFPENYELHFESSRSDQLSVRVEVLTRSWTPSTTRRPPL